MNTDINNDINNDINTDINRSGGAGDEGFLSRWSRRKHATQQLAPEEQPAAPPSAMALTVELTEADLPTDADLPSLETLDEHSDYSGFMSPRVSEELRQLALRKLFHSPAYNFRDPLDVYADDYTHFEPLGDIITADMKFQAEMAARQEVEKQLQAETQAMAGAEQNSHQTAALPSAGAYPQQEADAAIPPLTATIERNPSDADIENHS